MKSAAGLLMVLLAAPARGQEARSRAVIEIWNTDRASATPLDLSSRAGWVRIADGETPGSVTGDLVMTNGPVTLVIRRRDLAVEVYGGTTLRALTKA